MWNKQYAVFFHIVTLQVTTVSASQCPYQDLRPVLITNCKLTCNDCNNNVMLLVMQFGDVHLYVRIIHCRDAERHSSVSYSPAELNQYRPLITAAVTCVCISYYHLYDDLCTR